MACFGGEFGGDGCPPLAEAVVFAEGGGVAIADLEEGGFFCGG